jgi:HD superfamily phosphohydrolase
MHAAELQGVIRDAIHRARQRFSRSSLQTADLVQSVFRRYVGADGVMRDPQGDTVHSPAGFAWKFALHRLHDDAAHAAVVRRAEPALVAEVDVPDEEPPPREIPANAKRWLKTQIDRLVRGELDDRLDVTLRDPMSHGLVLRASLLEGWPLERIAAELTTRKGKLSKGTVYNRRKAGLAYLALLARLEKDDEP